MSAAAAQQPQAVTAAPKPAKEKKVPAVTRTMDQIDRKLALHSPLERVQINAYIQQKWFMKPDQALPVIQ
jgi:hypothetical protein